MKIAPTLSLAALALALGLPFTSALAENARVIESLNAGWRFTKSDAADAGTNLNYAAARPWLERSLRLDGSGNDIARFYLDTVERKLVENASGRNILPPGF